jgi:peptidoglycan hydrolase-like protein with peptidoglycan-binding domain
MLFFRASLGLLLSALVAVPAVASRTTHRKVSASANSRVSSASRSHRGLAASRRHSARGQQVIAPERATEIQKALIREHYLSGEATGKWDATTQTAMQKYQSDQGWQTKLMPDSRALKKLGLGADYSSAINAKTASFAAPPPISTIPPAQAAGFAAAAGTDHEAVPANKTN